jgi:acyl-homoserine lactone acylase PvdQ
MIRKLGISVLLLLLLAVLLFLNIGLLRNTLPQNSGRLPLAGLKAPVGVARTAEGIPTLQANSAEDVFRALGYVHAQDRLWQMELLRRTAHGNLAEILGPKYLATDQFILKWQFAQQLPDSLSLFSRQLLQTYCAGINAFIHAHSRQLPPEFSELKFKPENWQPTHCLAIWRFFGWINSGLGREIFHWNLQHTLSEQQLALFEVKPTGQAPNRQKILREFGDEFFRQIEVLAQLTGLRWRNDLTDPIPDSGATLVFAPRGRLTIPTVFYLQQLQTPEFNVWACAVPGVPFFPAGTNGKIAWTLVPQVGQDTRLLIKNENFLPLIETHFLIPVAAADTLVYSVLIEPNLFFLGMAWDSLANRAERISLDWTGFRHTDEFAILPALFESSRADSLPEIFRHFGAPLSVLNLADATYHFSVVQLGAHWEHFQRNPRDLESWQLTRGILNQSANPDDSKNQHRILLTRLLENLEIPTDPPTAALMFDYLQNWDLVSDSASVAATVFNLMLNHLLQNIFWDEMGERLFAQFLDFPELVLNSLGQILEAPNHPWIDNLQTPDDAETLSEIVQLSFRQTLDALSQKSLPAAGWANFTAFQIRHILARGNARDWWLNSETVDWRGSGFPTNLMRPLKFAPEKFCGNPLVLQFQLKHPVTIRWSLSTGQSGHPCSPNYRNQTNKWLTGRRQTANLANENKRARHRLILEPLIQKN